jgi:hypothetical protein
MRKLHAIEVKLPCYEIGDTFGYKDSLHEELLTEYEVRELGLRIFNPYNDEEDYHLSTCYSYSI